MLQDDDFLQKPKRKFRIVRKTNETNYEEINPGIFPKGDRWKFIPLYKTDVRGDIRSWQIRYEDEKLYVDYGKVGGKITTDPVTIDESRKGENINEKAFNKATSLYNHKIDREQYRTANSTERKEKAPMLAGKYGDPGSATLKEKDFEIGVAVEPKIDGCRFICRLGGDGNPKYRTRKFIQYKLDHIDEEITKFFRYFPPDTELDGEMWIEGLTFSQLSSIIRPTVNINPRLNEVKFYIFDIILAENPDATFKERYDIIFNSWKLFCKNEGIPNTLKIIEAEFVHSDEEIQNLHDKYVEMGYEGAMVKKLNAKYVHGRTNNQLKVKRFFDDEGTIHDVISTKGKETGYAELIIKDKNGNMIRGRPAASFENRAWMLEHADEIIGKKVRYKYQELSEYGIPRFIVPTGIIY